MGQSHPGGRSSRRITRLVVALPRSAEGGGEIRNIGLYPCAQRVKPVVWQSQRSATPLSAQTCRSMFRLSQARNQMACALPCESVIHKQAAVFNDFIYRTRLQRRA